MIGNMEMKLIYYSHGESGVDEAIVELNGELIRVSEKDDLWKNIENYLDRYDEK